MIKTYKFFSVDSREISRESGNYPIQDIVPYGPEHSNKIDAEEWLKETSEPKKKYLLIKIYST